MRRLTITTLRQHVPDTLQIVIDGERVLIERRGEPIVAIISPADLQLLELLEQCFDLEVVRAALKEPGRAIPWRQAKKALGL